MRLRVSSLNPSAFDEALRYGVEAGGFITVTKEQASAILVLNRSQKTDWPAWALVVALFAEDGDCGVGDTLCGELGRNSEAYKRHSEVIHGIMAKPCACAGQVAQLNAMFSYAPLTVA